MLVAASVPLPRQQGASAVPAPDHLTAGLWPRSYPKPAARVPAGGELLVVLPIVDPKPSNAELCPLCPFAFPACVWPEEVFLSSLITAWPERFSLFYHSRRGAWGAGG